MTADAALLDRPVDTGSGNTRPRFSESRRPLNRRSRRAKSRRCRAGSTIPRAEGTKPFVFLNNRHYDPSTGVFVSVDPLVTMTDQPYIYGAANPITFSDPDGLCPATGPDAAEACKAWAETETTGVSPQFWDEVVVPLAHGHLPTWQPDWIEHATDLQPTERSHITTLFNEWHNQSGLDPHMDTWTRFGMWQEGRLPESLLGQEFFPGLPSTMALDLALALSPASGRLPGAQGAVVPLAEQAFGNPWIGGNSRLFGNSGVIGGGQGTSGFLNQTGRFVKAGWSKQGAGPNGTWVFRAGLGRDAANSNAARFHRYLSGSHIPYVRGDVLVDVMRRLYAQK